MTYNVFGGTLSLTQSINQSITSFAAVLTMHVNNYLIISQPNIATVDNLHSWLLPLAHRKLHLSTKNADHVIIMNQQ